ATAVRTIVESQEEYAKEYNKAFVFMQYNGYLRRDPDLNGYNAWLTYLNAHPTDFREMVRGFMDSTEYRARFYRALTFQRPKGPATLTRSPAFSFALIALRSEFAV